jgi:Spy/CpxP family protein refolding chaperone
MKRSFLKITLVASIIFATISYASAQKPQNNPEPPKGSHEMKPGQPCEKGSMCLPDLSPEQQTKLEDLKMQHIKDVTPLKNQLKEKQARINTLMDAEKPDMAAINAAIDDFTAITNQLVKKKAEMQLAVRNILTDKQKIMFDAKSDLFKGDGPCMEGKEGRGKCCKGKGPGHGPGSGNGPQNHGENCPDHR